MTLRWLFHDLIDTYDMQQRSTSVSGGLVHCAWFSTTAFSQQSV
jgi:hypothetical protein